MPLHRTILLALLGAVPCLTTLSLATADERPTSVLLSPADDGEQHGPAQKNSGAKNASPWTPLFSGKDLTGWHRQPERGQHGTGGHWGVTKDGILFGEQDPPGSGNGGLLLSDQSYLEFELELSLRPDWGPDSGVFVRTDQRGGGWQIYVDHHDHGNVGHVRLETKQYSVPFRPWGFSRVDPAKPELKMAVDDRTRNWPSDVYEHTCTQEQWLAAWKTDEWNQLRIRVTGGDLPTIETWVNELKVCRFNAAATKHPKFNAERAKNVTRRSGAIGLQVHGGKSWKSGDRVYWKDIRIRNLEAGFAKIQATPKNHHRSTDFYVAPNGSDTNPGTKAKPFSTLEAARDAIRSLKKKGPLPEGGVTVWLRGGDYERTGALELTAADSGSGDRPIVWRAVEGERVRLLGGRKLANFERVTEASVLQRLASSARGKVWECSLKALGVTEFGEMKSRGFGRPTTPAHCELFFAERPMTLARWPNEGAWEKIADFPRDAAIGDGHGGQTGRLVDGFNYKGERPRRWKDIDDVWIHGYWSWDWANSYERVASIDFDRHLLKTAPPHGTYGFRKGQRFYFLNVLEELDQPGEWYLDHKSATVYFWPPQPMDSQETLLSLADEPFLRMDDVSHVTFRGLTLEATRGNAVEMQGGTGNLLAGCVIRNIGDWGVKIDGGSGHGMMGCDIFDTGDGGVELTGGDRMTLTPGGHFVENCHFQRQGRWSKCYVPAVHMQGVGQRVAHNLIHDHPHCAILFSGNDHSIEFNEIHHIAMETGDVGAIYTGRNYTYRGNRIRHNYIHHTSTAGSGGSMGVYMDDCVSGTEIYGNVFFKVHWAVFLGGGRDHLVENNIFVDCDPTLRMDGRGLDASTTWRNNVLGLGKSLREMPAELYQKRYPALASLDAYYGPNGEPIVAGEDFRGVPPEFNVVKRNICVGGKWLHVSWYADPELMELADNLVGEDPGFVSGERNSVRDFRLKSDSPALKSGFRLIPLERIGLRADEYRQKRGIAF